MSPSPSTQFSFYTESPFQHSCLSRFNTRKKKTNFPLNGQNDKKWHLFRIIIFGYSGSGRLFTETSFPSLPHQLLFYLGHYCYYLI